MCKRESTFVDSKKYKGAALPRPAPLPLFSKSRVFVDGDGGTEADSQIRNLQFWGATQKKGKIMQFDFDKFSKIAASVYPQSSPYSIEEALSVFRYYFQRYEDFTGHPHPPIKAAQIRRLCECMPFLDREGIGGSIADITPDCYLILIDKYFATKFRNCDRNIHHFLSGRVRELRFFEELY